MAFQSMNYRFYVHDTRGIPTRTIFFHSHSHQKFTDSRGHLKLLNPRSPSFVPRSMHQRATYAPVSSWPGSRFINEDYGICDVWKSNLEAEFKKIRKIVQKYHYIAMDTEFPGIVARPSGENGNFEQSYGLLRCNVNLLHIIQLGFTFMDEDGNTPPGFSTWQFNFNFDLGKDMYSMDSIELLRSAGIQFQRHKSDGIDPIEFAELLMMSGIVLMDNIKFVCFHSGYDFGYLIKLLTNQELPETEAEYYDLVQTYFPEIYDIKYLMKLCRHLKGGLQEVANQLELRRIGKQHQAGSDALLTGMAFFKMRKLSKVRFEPTPTYLDRTGEFSIEYDVMCPPVPSSLKIRQNMNT